MIFTNVDDTRKGGHRHISLVCFIRILVVVEEISISRLCTASNSWTSKVEKLSKAWDKSDMNQEGSKKPQDCKFIKIHMNQYKVESRAGGHSVSCNQFQINYSEITVTFLSFFTLPKDRRAYSWVVFFKLYYIVSTELTLVKLF